MSHLDTSIMFYSVSGFFILLFIYSWFFSSFFNKFFYKISKGSDRTIVKNSKWFLN